MKTTLFLILIMSIFSCTEKKENAVTPTINYCECEKIIKTDSVFFATNISIKKEVNEKIAVFNCATIETAIASVIDKNGTNARCKNIYNIRCISSAREELQLSKDFSYYSADMQNTEITKEGWQNLFFEDLENSNQHYFEFNLNTMREITSISRLDIK